MNRKTSAPAATRDRALLQQGYSFVVTSEPTRGFTARVAEFPGCVSQGASRAGALEALEDAALEWLAAARKSGYPVPPPVQVPTASGRILVRASRTLHARLLELADREGVSLNQLVVTVLAERVGMQPPASEQDPLRHRRARHASG